MLSVAVDVVHIVKLLEVQEFCLLTRKKGSTEPKHWHVWTFDSYQYELVVCVQCVLPDWAQYCETLFLLTHNRQPEDKKCVTLCICLNSRRFGGGSVVPTLLCFVFAVVLWSGEQGVGGCSSSESTAFPLCLQAKVNNLSSAVVVIRIMRDLCDRVPTWSPLSGWVRGPLDASRLLLGSSVGKSGWLFASCMFPVPSSLRSLLSCWWRRPLVHRRGQWEQASLCAGFLSVSHLESS